MKKLFLRILAVLILLVTLVVAGAWWYANPGRAPKPPEPSLDGAWAEKVGNTKILHVKGSPYQIGFQQGALAKDETRATLRGFDGILSDLADEAGLPRLAITFGLDILYRQCLPYIDERFVREMEGFADGAGVELKMVRRLQVVSEVTDRNCSVFAVFGKATAGGKMFFGRNFDWNMEVGIQNQPLLTLYEPEGRTAFASANYAGMLGVISGMTVNGLVMGSVGAISKDARSVGEPLMHLTRRVLEDARNVDDAGSIIAKAHRTIGYNYVVADAKGPAARAFETTANHCASFSDNDPGERQAPYAIPIENAVFRADDAMDQAVRALQLCSNGYPNSPEGSESYDHRYKGIATDIKNNYGKIDEGVALEILKAAAMRDINLQSVLFDATDGVVWVANANGAEDAWKQPYARYDLRQLFARKAK